MKRTIASILPLLMFAGLGACSRNSDERPVGQLAETSTAQVEKREQQFVVPAVRGKAELSAIYRRGFDKFLADAAPGDLQSVHLSLWGGAPQIVAALRQAAIADGVEPSKIEIASAAPASSSGTDVALQTTVTATTYVVSLPSCARRSVTAFSNSQNPSWSDFGCSVNGSLAAMVADPHDLIAGQTGGETDSAISGTAIDRLLQDKVKKFDSQTFTPGGSAGGSAGGASP